MDRRTTAVRNILLAFIAFAALTAFWAPFLVGAQAQVPPTVGTLTAGAVTSNSASLDGAVNPNGYSTSVWFVYGTSQSTLDQSTSPLDVGSGNVLKSVGIGVTGLNPNATYYYQIVANNQFGTTEGSIVSFTTSAGSGGSGGTSGSGGPYIMCNGDTQCGAAQYPDLPSCNLDIRSNCVCLPVPTTYPQNCANAQFSGNGTLPSVPTNNGSPSSNSSQPSGGVTPHYAPIPGPAENYVGPQSTSDVINLVNNILYWISGIFWLLAFIFIFYAAFLYLTAGGDSERVSKAHSWLKWIVVAIIVGIMTRGLPYLIGQFLAYH